MSRPRVTVIIAARDYGRFLPMALDAVRSQSLRDWECIAVDDGSTDGTPAILDEAARSDPRMRTFRHAEGMGVSAARNAALAQARGAYIQFLDADDAIAPGKLERQAAYLDAHPEAAVVCSDFAHFTGQPGLSAPGELRSDERMDGTGEQVLRRLLRGNAIRINTALVRAAVVRRAGGFRADLRAVEDWHLWMAIAAQGGRFAFLDDPACLAAVRVNPAGLSKDAPGMRRYRLPALQDIWARQPLGALAAGELVLRAAMMALEMRLARHEPVILLPERKGAFLLRLLPAALALLPFWLLSRPFRKRR